MADAVAALVWCPFPDRESAKRTASQLLEKKLVACANLFGEMESVYSWQGEVQADRECGALFKTEASRIPEVTAAIAFLHPYETPVILGWKCDCAFPATLGWLKESLESD